MDKLEALPKYEIDCAKEKRAKVGELVYNIQGAIKLSNDSFEAIREMIKENIKTEDNKDGLFSQTLSSYDTYLKLDVQGLNKLFDLEKLQWDENLVATEKRVASVEDELMQMISAQQDALEEYLTKFQQVKKAIPAPIADSNQPKYTLKHLGFIDKSKTVENQSCFMWPDWQTMSEMADDVYVSKIEF